MKCYISFACVLSVLIAVSLAAPLDSGANGSVSVQAQAGGNLLGGIDTGALLQSASRILSLIRQFCPELSQVLDNVIQSVTSQVFRVLGRAILQNGGLGGGGGNSSGGGRVSVVLPTFPPDDYDDEDEEDEENTGLDERISNTTKTETSSGTPSDKNNEVEDASNAKTPTLYTSSSANNEENSVAAKRHVRRTRAAEDTDQDAAASGGNAGPQPADDLSNIDDADRNKRYSPFAGGAVDAHAGAGGSGNFLFDIIRGTADNAARAVGTVYRMVAGTENLGIGVTATSTSTKAVVPGKGKSAAAKLIAGSGATEDVEEKDNAAAGGVAEIDVAKAADGYTEGIPGPITRLFVIANRGIANLVQDLILRLAQTSERIVNFKARLITSLI